MEGHLPYSGRALRANSYVLWVNKLTSHIPNDDEYHIPTSGHARMVLYFYG